MSDRSIRRDGETDTTTVRERCVRRECHTEIKRAKEKQEDTQGAGRYQTVPNRDTHSDTCVCVCERVYEKREKEKDSERDHVETHRDSQRETLKHSQGER